MAKKKDDIIVIKKYANRRLYNTGTSTYVTLDDLAEMVKRDEEFVVQDAKSGDDITHSVLTQIIFELENKNGQTMLPVSFLRQLISFYGDHMQMIVPSFLEQSMLAFTKEQERMREQLEATFGASPMDMMKMQTPLKFIEERVERMMDIWGGLDGFDDVEAEERPAREGDAALLNGPALDGAEGVASQDDIDALFD